MAIWKSARTKKRKLNADPKKMSGIAKSNKEKDIAEKDEKERMR